MPSFHKLPKWSEGKRKQVSTRERSNRQEAKVAQLLKGRTTINSGATFGENDVTSEHCEVECKITSKGSYSLKVAEWKLLASKCNVHKIPVEVIEFEKDGLELAILPLADLVSLLENHK